MKPFISILDRSFRYVPSVSTSVADTWRRFGWRPMTQRDRDARAKPVDAVSSIRTLVRRADIASASREAQGVDPAPAPGR